MSKLLTTFAIAALTVGMASCGSSTDEAATAAAATDPATAQRPVPADGVDSLSYYMGGIYGARYNLRGPVDEDLFEAYDFDKEQFLEAVRQVVMADTTEAGYLDGVYAGVKFARDFNGKNALGMPLDRAKFMEQFTAVFNDGIPSDAEVSRADEVYSDLISKANRATLEYLRKQRRIKNIQR